MLGPLTGPLGHSWGLFWPRKVLLGAPDSPRGLIWSQQPLGGLHPYHVLGPLKTPLRPACPSWHSWGPKKGPCWPKKSFWGPQRSFFIPRGPDLGLTAISWSNWIGVMLQHTLTWYQGFFIEAKGPKGPFLFLEVSDDKNRVPTSPMATVQQDFAG